MCVWRSFFSYYSKIYLISPILPPYVEKDNIKNYFNSKLFIYSISKENTVINMKNINYIYDKMNILKNKVNFKILLMEQKISFKAF